MRYLNKIIFINSAHIRYAEIKLDGNVHFIGTQGVGKSTILRAILYFYNADKQKLGIQKNQKPFEEFYLPTPNSYLIYEVKRENGYFFVVVSRMTGRPAYHFVDCAYQRDFFVDEAGEVTSEWRTIAKRIGNHYCSPVIQYHERYRDIIYGNNKDLPAPQRRFSIMESKKYQNIPKAIQNIFLNQSLESRVIKDIIIDSMDFEDSGIKLGYYREQVKKFRMEYEDIWKWYRTDKYGKVKVRTDADNVVSSYNSYMGTLRMAKDLAAELVFARERDEARLPELQKKFADDQQELDRLVRLLGEENDKYDAEREKLIGSESVLKDKLSELKRKKTHYQEIGIENIIEKMNQENALQIRRDSLTKQMDIITDKNRSVTEQYEELKKQERQKLSTLKNQTEAEKNEAVKKLNERVGQLQQAYLKVQQEKTEFYQQQLAALQERLDATKDDRQRILLQRVTVTHSNPFEDEMKEYQQRLKEVSDEQVSLKLEAQRLNGQMDNLKNTALMKSGELRSAFELYRKDQEQKVAVVEEKLAQLQKLLDATKGSLAEWLTKNVDNWEESFGKVLDESSVLYNTELSPRRESSDKTVFGVHLDVDKIDRQVRTPQDIQREKSDLEQQRQQLKKELDNRRQQMEDEVEKSEASASKKIKDLKNRLNDVKTELNILPQKQDKYQRQLDEATDKLSQWRKEQTDQCQQKLEKVDLRLTQLKTDKKNSEEEKNKKLNNLLKEHRSEEQKLRQEHQQEIKLLDEQLEQWTSECQRRLRELDASMDAELKKSGVDTHQLNQLRLQLEQVERELRFISDHRQDYYNWQKDKREYFDRETEMREQSTLLRQKLDELGKKYKARKEKYEQKMDAQRQSLREHQDEIKYITEALTDVKNFLESRSLPFEIDVTERKETVKKLGNILNELRDRVTSMAMLKDVFTSNVKVFMQNFDAENAFHFPKEFGSDEEYFEFAVKLNDFLLNNMIEEYRQHVSSRYLVIINQITKEVNDMMSYKGKIEGTIKDINDDFKQNNFVGVIKDIELRSVESNDPLMQLLLNISHFADQEGQNLGKLNLFNDEASVERANQRAVNLMMNLMDQLELEQKRDLLTVADSFKLEFKVRENDNDTGWVEKLSNVGSDGTDVLVKAMVNIMLINVFKKKESRKFGDFRIHCLMDEIGKLHPNNVMGILDFASKRNIYLINSSPTTYTAEAYKYTYSLSKDSRNNTVVRNLLAIN